MNTQSVSQPSSSGPVARTWGTRNFGCQKNKLWFAASAVADKPSCVTTILDLTRPADVGLRTVCLGCAFIRNKPVMRILVLAQFTHKTKERKEFETHGPGWMVMVPSKILNSCCTTDDPIFVGFCLASPMMYLPHPISCMPETRFLISKQDAYVQYLFDIANRILPLWPFSQALFFLRQLKQETWIRRRYCGIKWIKDLSP